MMCEECGRRPAVFHFMSIVNGETTEHALCPSCMARMTFGGSGQPEAGIENLIRRLLSEHASGQAEKDLSEPEKTAEDAGGSIDIVCPQCGMSYADFKAKGQFSCSECPKAFREELSGMLAQSQGTAQYVGRAPGSAMDSAEPDRLRVAMARAIAAEDYERAAALRDALHALQTSGVRPGSMPDKADVPNVKTVDRFSAPEQDVVMTSRVRLLRNFEDLPFSLRMDRFAAEELIDRVARTIAEGPNGTAFKLCRLRELGMSARQRLREQGILGEDMLSAAYRSAALISAAGTMSVLLAGEDHVCYQAGLPGLQPERCANMAQSMEMRVGQRHGYAFDEQFGFLTAQPEHLGGGMVISVQLFLPALCLQDRIETIAQSVAENGLVLKTEADGRGSFFTLENTGSIGLCEDELVQRLSGSCAYIVGLERAAREEIEKKDMPALQDKLLRSYGAAQQARIVSEEELPELLSDVRFAACMGYLHMPLPALDALLRSLRRGALASMAGTAATERDIEILRARLLRERLKTLEKDMEE